MTPRRLKPWYRQPFFWVGWLAGGMVCPLAFGLTMTANGVPYHWEINVGYALASFPPIIAAWIAQRRQNTKMRQIREQLLNLNNQEEDR